MKYMCKTWLPLKTEKTVEEKKDVFGRNSREEQNVSHFLLGLWNKAFPHFMCIQEAFLVVQIFPSFPTSSQSQVPLIAPSDIFFLSKSGRNSSHLTDLLYGMMNASPIQISTTPLSAVLTTPHYVHPSESCVGRQGLNHLCAQSLAGGPSKFGCQLLLNKAASCTKLLNMRLSIFSLYRQGL